MGRLLEVVAATKNEDKFREIRELLKDLGIRLLSLKEFPQLPKIEEGGRSLKENAIKKARLVAGYTGKLALADDSGLEVEALGGRPGVLSSRFAGEGVTYRKNNEKLLTLLKGIPYPKRKATFRCVLAIFQPDGHYRVVEGRCDGIIAKRIRGSGGFGYDPIFILPEYGKTFAELGSFKQKISHRARAIKKLRKILRRLDIEGKMG